MSTAQRSKNFFIAALISMSLAYVISPAWNDYLIAASVAYYVDDESRFPSIDNASLRITLPVLGIDSLFGLDYYCIELDTLETEEGFQFVVVSAELTEGFESVSLPTYSTATTILTIPEIEVLGELYYVELTLSQTDPTVVFTLTEITLIPSE